MTALTDTEKAAWKCPSCGDGLFASGCMSCAYKRPVPAESAPAPAVSPWEALLQWSRDQDPEHAGNGPFISLQHEGDEFDKPASVGVVDGSAAPGEGKTANEAARDLCAKLGIELAPAPTEGVGGVTERHLELAAAATGYPKDWVWNDKVARAIAAAEARVAASAIGRAGESERLLRDVRRCLETISDDCMHNAGKGQAVYTLELQLRAFLARSR